MRMSVKLKFSSQWANILNRVAQQCNMTVDQYCERAVMLITKQGLEQGQKQMETEQGVTDDGTSTAGDDSTHGITQSDTRETLVGVSTDSAALSDQTDAVTSP